MNLNHYILFGGTLLLATALFQLVRFFRQPSDVQVRQVKEWLLFAVTEAEKQFGSGTGNLKLRSVYDLFVARFPWIARVIPFATFAFWVEEALENMQQWLEKNQAIADYVSGSQPAAPIPRHKLPPGDP